MTALRRVILHVGTHKTGTKTFQAFLMENRLPFARAGIYVPAAGRHALSETHLSPGHHALAWDLLAGRRAVMDEVLEDIDRANAPTVILSAEDLQYLAALPQHASYVRDAFAAHGYVTAIVLYLRAQSSYLESLYAELTKALVPQPFHTFIRDACLRGTVVTEGLPTVPLVYSQLIMGFAAAFGPQNIVVRPYAEQAAPRALIDDFLQSIARLHGGLEMYDLHWTLTQANRRGTFGAVLERIYEHRPDARASNLDDEVRLAPFAPLTYDETRAVIDAFANDNAQVESMARIRIAGAHREDLAPPDDPRWRIARAQHDTLNRLLR